MYRGDVPGYVVLADGTVYSGFGFGAQGRVLGEVVFNTGMTGYQEIATDPSYHGQMVTFTYPMIGNYGVSDRLLESVEVHSRALVVRETKNSAWNATCPEPWVDWLTAHGIVGVGGIDTRALTRRIREHGAMTACVAAGSELEIDELLAQARDFPSMMGLDLVSAVSCRESYDWMPNDWEPTAADAPVGAEFDVVAVDYGIKRSILRNLSAVGCSVTVVPASWTAEQILALKPDGVFLSNGPGDPAAVGYAVDIVRGLVDRVPLFGICLGHQLLALALGFSTYKLKFGHRGINHPVRDYQTGRIEITSQNHGFAVEPPEVVRAALATGSVVGAAGVAGLRAEDMIMGSDFGPTQVTHLNLNDGTVEGLRLLELPVYSVQYHPEAGPGPHDSYYLFKQFTDLMRDGAAARKGIR
jgi:carbamoyl-phosphate synthase small subunit